MTPKTKSFLLTSFTLALVAISALSMLAGFTTAALAQPAAQDASQGETLFKEKCIVCHTIGGGNLVGPDLDGVTERREVQWLAEGIPTPAKLLAGWGPHPGPVAGRALFTGARRLENGGPACMSCHSVAGLGALGGGALGPDLTLAYNKY